MKTQPKIVLAIVALSYAFTDAHAMRWYSPSTGRWLSRDPIEEYGGFNLYGFVRGNPVGLLDLSGLVVLDYSLVVQQIPTIISGLT